MSLLGSGFQPGYLPPCSTSNPAKLAYRCNHASGSQHAALDRTSLTGDNLHHFALGADSRQVRGGLDEARNIGAHGQNPMMQAREQCHSFLCIIRIHYLARVLGFLCRDLQPGIESSQVSPVSIFSRGYERFHFILARRASNTKADASRGIAFCALPPLISAISTGRRSSRI